MTSQQNICIKTDQFNVTLVDNSLKPNQPVPRCLAVLPNNIEELIHQFKMQNKGESADLQLPYFLTATKNSIN